MKVFFLASLLVVAVSASLLEEHAAKFQEFKTAHGKSYLNQVEETKRFSIFRDNLRSIEEHNALYAQGLVSYTKKITKFADQTREEFKAFLSLHQKPIVNATNYTKYVKTGVAVADSVDWRQQGQVTPVKDQGNCGACWSFSVVKHGKEYMNQAEEAKRFAIFVDNLRAIEEHNALYDQGLVSYKQGVNQFSDKTTEEFKAYLGLQKKPSLNAIKYVKTGVAVPDSVDWREKGQVGPVKDQGQCGGCWSFSLTVSTEAAYYRKSGKLASLSEQQLIDCTSYINYGCDGGYLDYTFPYIEEQGLQTEESYPFKGHNGKCQYDSSKVVTKISKFVSMAEDESSLLKAVATIGPVSVAMDASYLSGYNSGIFEGSSCTPAGLNHAVLVIGYGTENGKDYWIVKNSWGTNWGEDGFFKIKRGANECGIAEDNVYPLIN